MRAYTGATFAGAPSDEHDGQPPGIDTTGYRRLHLRRKYYRDNPGVEVIVDRRYGGPNDRRRGETGVTDERRVTRDRRRARAIGTFPRIEAFDTADS